MWLSPLSGSQGQNQSSAGDQYSAIEQCSTNIVSMIEHKLWLFSLLLLASSCVFQAHRQRKTTGEIYSSYSTVVRDIWQRKPPLPSGSGRFTTIYPYNRAITITYIIYIVP